MASIDFAAGSNVNDMLMFGSYCQTISAMGTGSADGMKPLSPEETAYITGTAAYDNPTAAIVCRQRLDLGIDYYYAVKQQIRSLLRVWDAVLDEKHRYDTVGWLERSRSFMDSFQLCSYLIPQRVSIGSFGPILGAPQPDTSAHDIHTGLSPRTSFYSETSTIINTPTDWAEYENPMHDSGYGDRTSSDGDGDPEDLAISPTLSYISFEDDEFQDLGAAIISVTSNEGASDEGASDSEYSYHSSDSDDSDQSEVPRSPLGLNGGSIPKASFGDPGSYQLSNSEDTRMGRLPNNLHKAQEPVARKEKRQCDENAAKRWPLSNKRKARSLDLEDLKAKKRQAAVHGSDGSRAGTGRGSKRLRTL